jgi:hypothetical protein
MKSVPLNKLLMLQMAYCFTGIIYNVCSLLAQRNGQQAWASTDAVVGVAVVALYGLFLSTGLMQNLSSYRILMAISVILFGYGGVGVHIVSADQMELYQSAWTWAAAIGINGFGLLLNLVAACGWFSREFSHPDKSLM